MAQLLLKIIPALIFWGIFGYVILQIPYPESLTQANITQLILFFIPLFLALTVTSNLFIKNVFSSSIISLGIICLFILKALDSLNLVTGLLTVISIWLLVSYFKKVRIPRLRLSNGLKKVKLTHMQKHMRHPEERLKRRRI